MALFKSKPEWKAIVDTAVHTGNKYEITLKIRSEHAARCVLEFVYSGNVLFSKPDEPADVLETCLDVAEFADRYEQASLAALAASYAVGRCLTVQTANQITGFFKDHSSKDSAVFKVAHKACVKFLV